MEWKTDNYTYVIIYRAQLFHLCHVSVTWKFSRFLFLFFLVMKRRSLEDTCLL